MSINVFFIASGLVFLIGFSVRDIVMSRALFAFAIGLLIYGGVSAGMDFLLLMWGFLALFVNLGVIWRQLAARYTTPLTDAEMALQRELPGFSDSDFRRLMKLAKWEKLDAPKQLTEQGVPADALYYIVSGSATVNKSGTEIPVGDNVLIGEISFTQDVPTTATVEAHAGSVLVKWPSKKLHKLMKRKSLKAAFDDLLAHDLAEKLAADETRRQEGSAEKA